MNDNKQYIIQIPGEEHVAYWNEEKYGLNEEELFKNYPNAQVTEMTIADPRGDIADDDQFAISIPGESHVAQWDGKKLAANRDQLLEMYPDAQVSRLSNVTAQRDADFVQRYEDATSVPSMENTRFIHDNEERYQSLMAKYTQPQEEPQEEEKTGKGGFLNRANNLFKGLNRGENVFGAWQNLKGLFGGVLSGTAEVLRGGPLAQYNRKGNDLIWEAANEEFQRRLDTWADGKQGEAIFQTNLEPSSADRAEQATDPWAYNRKKQANKLINDLMKEAEEKGEDPEKYVASALKKGLDTSIPRIMQDAATKMMEESQAIPMTDAMKVGGILPMAGSTIGAVALASTGNVAGAQALGNATMAAFTASAYGNAVKQARDAGANDTQANMAGLATAAIFELMAKIPLNRAISRAFSNSAARSVSDFVMKESEAGLKGVMEKELELLYQDAAKNGLILKEGAEKILFKELAKNWVGQTASHTVSFATMNAMQAMVPLIYEDSEKYPVLANVLESAKQGAVDGMLLGALTGGFSGGMELAQRMRRWEGRKYVAIAEVDFGGVAPTAQEGDSALEFNAETQKWESRKVEPREVKEYNPRTGKWEDSTIDPDKVYFAELTSIPNGKDEFVTARIDDGGRKFSVKIGKGDIRVGKFIEFGKAKEGARAAYTDQGFEQGRLAETGQQREAIRNNLRYLEAKSQAEEQSGGVSEGTRLDLERANAAMEGRRESVRDEIQQRTGQQFWKDIAVEGQPEQQSVDVITLADGSQAFVLAEDEAGLAYVDEAGNKRTIQKNSPDIASRQTYNLNDFLDARVKAQDAQAEQQRMAAEHAQNISKVEQALMEHGNGERINLGTQEEENWVPIIGMDMTPNGGIVIKGENGAASMMPWKEVASRLGVPMEPKTSDDLVQERLSADAQVNKYNTIPQGAELQVPVEGAEPMLYKFRSAELIEGDIIIRAEDPMSGEVVDLTPEIINNLDVLTEKPQPVDVQAPEVVTPPAEDVSTQIFNDPAANQLGITKDYAFTTKGGQTVVNGRKLWDENPRLWAKWNDLNESRDVPTKDFLEAKIKGIEGEVSKARTALDMEAKGNQDPDRLIELRENLRNKEGRRAEVQTLLDEYEAAEKELQRQAEEQARLQKEAEEQAVREAEEAKRIEAERLEAERLEKERLEAEKQLKEEVQEAEPVEDIPTMAETEAVAPEVAARDAEVAGRIADILTGKDTDVKRYRQAFLDNSSKGKIPEKYFDEIKRQWSEHTSAIEKQKEPLGKRMAEIGEQAEKVAVEKTKAMLAKNNHTLEETPNARDFISDYLGEELKNNQEYQDLLNQWNALDEKMSVDAWQKFRGDAVGMLKADYAEQPAENGLDQLYSMLGTTREQAPLDRLANKMTDIDRRVNENPADKDALMNEKAEAIQEFIETEKTVEGANLHATSVANLADAMVANGHRQEFADGVVSVVKANMAAGIRPRSFATKSGHTYILADNVQDVQDVQTAHIHEEEHIVTSDNGDHIKLMGMEGASRDGFLNALDGWVGYIPAYHGLSDEGVADEFISHAIERTFGHPEEEVTQTLNKAGVDSEEIINLVKNRNNGRSDRLRRSLPETGRRGSEVLHAAGQEDAGQDGGNIQEGSRGNLERQGYGSGEESARGVGGGEPGAAESGAVAPQEITSIAEAAIQKNDGLNFSMATEEMVVQKIRDFAKSEEGKKLGWSDPQIESILQETGDLINAIHAAVSGDKFYDEWAKKNPTVKIDWRDGVEKPTVTWSRANIEYKYDMSADLLCINNEGLETVLASPTMVELMMRMNEATKEGFTSDDYLRLYSTLRDMGFVVPCKGCFDAAMRLKMLPSVSRKFVDLVNKTIDERNADPEKFDAELRQTAGENATIEGLPTSAKNKEEAVRIGVAGDKLTEHMTWAQLMSAEGQTKALSDWGGIFRAWQRTGAGRPKDKLLPEPWTGDIVSTTTTIIGKYGEKTPSYRDILVNRGTGLRRNSHSEFRPLLAIDEIQFMREAFIRNLTVFKYMKELDDVRLFGNLGVKFNMSFFPEFVEGAPAAGLDANGDYVAAEESVGGREFEYIGADGKTHYDGMKGWQEAKNHLNKDVSLSSVVFSVPHLIKTLTDVPTKSNPVGEWGSLIPFHASGATAGSLEKQGLGKARAIGVGHGFEEAMTDYDKGVTNFEAVQNDRFGEGWEILEGKKAGTSVEPGHKLEFANGTHYYNKDLGLHLFPSFYIYDNEIQPKFRDKKGNLIQAKAKAAGHPLVIDYNDKVREIGTNTAYQDASDFYVETLRNLGLIPRFDFTVPEETFLQMCEAAKVDPTNPKLGWKGQGNDWSPVDSEGYYTLWCDYGMIDPATGNYAPHNPVGLIDENGNRVFKLPDNAIDIIKKGIERYSKRRSIEEERAFEAIEEYAKRSVADGKLTKEDADAILSSAKEEIENRPYGISKGLDAAQSKTNKVPDSKAKDIDLEEDGFMLSLVNDSPDDEIMFSLTKNNRSTIESWLKKREDLKEADRNDVMEYLEGLNDARTQLATAKWFTKGTIRIPEDMPKVEQAISVAGKAKVDPLMYDSPMALLDAHADFKPTEKRIDPNTVKTLHKVKEYPEQGIVIYDVDGTEESRENMRQIINTHYGKDASPWCLLQGDGEGNLTGDSQRYWKHYNGYPKQVAFKDGKLLAFSANDSKTRLWWDRQDRSHYGVPVTQKVEGDELGRSKIYAYDPVTGEYAPEPGAHMFRGNRQNGVYEEWNSDGTVQLEMSEYKDGELNGTQLEWFPSGQIRERSSYIDGNYVGKHEFWHENGNRRMTTNFDENGVRHGLYEYWNSAGHKVSEVNYEHGTIIGDRKEWSDFGDLESVQHYNNEGDLVGFEEYKGGRIHTKVEYTEKGQNVTKYWNTGNISRFTEYGSNQGDWIDGVDERYRPDGSLASRDRYDNSGLQISSETFSGGRLSSVTRYKRGRLDGISKVWDNKGNLTEMQLFKNDELVRDLLAEGVTEEDADNLHFSFVTDEQELERLEKEPTVTLYRAMAQIDGKLYPPMSTKEPNGPGQRGQKLKLRQPSELGRWERSDEAPDKAKQGKDGKWYFDLKKGNGGDVNGVLYNPYFHTSASPLNDQFSGAINYPELVTVAVEVPVSEFSSAYKADKANDTVGPKDWHSGTVTGQLGEGRQVVLTRWAKPTRIVPDSEVASIIAPKLIDKKIVVPSNVVTPTLKAELEKRGVVFDGKPSDYDNKPQFSLVAQDKDYMEAVNGGDMEKAGQMVREAAASAMPDTKVIDEDGKPLLMYHASGTKGITEFKKDKIRAFETDATYNGFWFSSSEDTLPAWVHKEALYKVFLDIKNPIMDRDADKVAKEVMRKLDENENSDAYPGARSLQDAVRMELQARGYDGVMHVYPPTLDEEALERDGKTVITLANGLKYLIRKGDDYNYEAYRYRYDSGSKEYYEDDFTGGYDTVEEIKKDPYFFDEQVWVAFEPNQIKSAESVTYDDNGKVIPLSERFNEGNEDIRFSLVNERQEVFVSNAAKAVDGIQNEKATPEQWLKQLEKNGGLKAGEDKWIGLSDWLKSQDKKSLTKQEVLDYINEHKIQIEETHYAKESEQEYDQAMESYEKEYLALVDEGEANGEYNAFEYAFEQMVERYGDDFGMAFHRNGNVIEPDTDWNGDLSDAARYFLNQRVDTDTPNPINPTRLQYTTINLDNKHEIALTVPTIEPWNESDSIHFGDAGEGRAIAWIRFGDTKYEVLPDWVREAGTALDGLRKKYQNKLFNNPEMTEEDEALRDKSYNAMEESMANRADRPTKRVLVIDEIQSKRHQEGREKGYRMTDKERAEVFGVSRTAWRDYQKAQGEYTDYLQSVFGEAYDPVTGSVPKEQYDLVSPSDDQIEHITELSNAVKEAKKNWQEANDNAGRFAQDTGMVPAAPFEKNWHELAMKRMLRYAAEEGYDAIAWTTGAQQANRYALDQIVSRINVYPSTQNDTRIVNIHLAHSDGDYHNLVLDKDGQVIHGKNEYMGHNISQIVGKDTAVKIMTAKESTEFKEDNLRIGGEGMKGFYDDILPRFMNKYGKKWGVSVSDMELPIGETGKEVMHAIPVTDEMRESVMEGQPMFSMVQGAGVSDKDYLAAVESGDMDKAQEMVDEAAAKAGYTINGYHGTTQTFTIFDRSKGNAEGNWGKGFYFTNSHDDALVNYGNEDGPDLTVKVERLAENMEWMDGYEDMDYDQRMEEAKKMLVGDDPRVISAAIRMDNPVIFNSRAVGPKETFFDFDSGYNPETDEYDGEESGLLLDFINAWNEELDSWEWDGYVVRPDEILEYGYDGLTASQLESKAREILDTAGIQNSNGELASGEFLRAVFERMGFDGIVDNNVNTKFGTQRKYGRAMAGMGYGVSHIVAFHPNQIKQTDPVTYDDNGNVIPLSERFNEDNDDIRFSFRGLIGAENAKDQEALDNLDVAEEMERAGKDAASIWIATGWEKGADGKWRNEIPDARQKEGTSLEEKGLVTYVGDAIDAPELFQSYPTLADLIITLDNSHSAGSYAEDEQTIYLNKGYNTKTTDGKTVLTPEGRRTLIHELQHAVQAIEGFARGGSEAAIEKQYYLDTAKKSVEKAIFAWHISRKNSATKLMRVGKDRVTHFVENFDTTQLNEDDRNAFAKMLDYLKGIDEEEYRTFVRSAATVVRNAKKAGETGYRNLAGEVEARNAETRSNVSPEARRMRPISSSESVPRADQIVRFKTSSAQSRKEVVKTVAESGKPRFAEVVGGQENLDELYDKVYRAIPRDILAPVVERAMNDGFNVRKHVDAYLHDLAKNGTENDETGLLRAVYDQVRAYSGNPDLSDNDIRYMIWKATSDAKDGDILSLAEDIATRRRWGVGEETPMFSMTGDFADSADDIREQYEAKVSEAERLRKEEKKNIRKTFADGMKPITKAMAAQKAYDKTTVDGITKFAKAILKEGNVDALTFRETNRLLALVNAANGKSPASATRYSDQLLDLVLDHAVKQEAGEFEKLVKVKDKATSQSGVETLGKLDARGQIAMKAFRDGRDMKPETFEQLLLDNSERMHDPSDAVRENAFAEYEGLMAAQRYRDGLAENLEEAKVLERELEYEEQAKKTGNIDRKTYNEYVSATKEAIRENKMERVDLYREMKDRLGNIVAGGTSRAKAFRDAEKLRIEYIHHDANRDMGGVPTNEHRTETRQDRLINSDAARFFFKPLATFDQMLRVLGRKNMSGEGYLWNRYMRGWVDAAEKSYTGLFEATEELDKKVSEVFGKDMIWSDLYAIERKMPKATVKFMDGGDLVEHELTAGNLLYIYMVDKMVDGRMKLRKMGIDEGVVQEIKNSLDPRFIELADWVQEDFLVKKRNKYNEVHERMFGAPMADIQDYFPIKILSNARIEEVDLGNKPDGSGLSSTTTGSIIKRRKNSLALDLLHTDAFSLVIEHLEQMEDWAAFAEYRRDLNTLLSYKRFRNQLQNLKTIYGTGKALLDNFKDAASIASGQYRPKVGKGDVDTAVLNISKGVTAAKIAFRVNTALKQVLSAPAFLPEVNMVELGKSLANPAACWNWCMENLPVFMKRWKSRIAGDTRLLDTDSDYKIWRNNIVKTASRLGMSPNAFVDATTIAVGAKSIYETRKKRYLADGYSETAADRKAKQDATILYNQTQQSAEGPFVSAMQLDRTFLSVMLTTFRNSSMGYQRQLHDALRGLGREFDATSKEARIDFMAKQRENEGADEESARRGAERDYGRQKWRNLARVAIFGFGLQLLWNIGNDIWYLLFGKNDKKKKKILKDASMKGLAGPIEGMAGGNIVSDAWGSISSGEGTQYIGMGELPIVSDIKQILQEMEYDQPAAINDIASLIIQAGVGVNPDTLTDTVVAVIDACNGDLGVAKEAALLMMRIAQIPQSTIDEFYIDELETSAAKARKMTPNQLAKRYAEYRLKKETPLTNSLYDEKTEARRRKSYENRIKKKIKERKQ